VACNQLSATNAIIEKWIMAVKLLKLLNGIFFIRPKSELVKQENILHKTSNGEKFNIILVGSW
jgi:hypothetical protein